VLPPPTLLNAITEHFYLVVIAKIFSGIWGLTQNVDWIANQQRTGLGLVIRRDVVCLRQRLAQDVTIVLIRFLRPNKNADTMLGLSIKIPDIAISKVVNYETVRWKRVHRLFGRGVIGDLDLETGGG